MNNNRKKVEFSKKIMLCVGLVNAIVLIFSMYMIFVTRDLSPLYYIVPAVCTEFGVGSAFYYNKAKAENLIKIKKEYGLSYDDIKEIEQDIMR